MVGLSSFSSKHDPQHHHRPSCPLFLLMLPPSVTLVRGGVRMLRGGNLHQKSRRIVSRCFRSPDARSPGSSSQNIGRNLTRRYHCQIGASMIFAGIADKPSDRQHQTEYKLLPLFCAETVSGVYLPAYNSWTIAHHA